MTGSNASGSLGPNASQQGYTKVNETGRQIEVISTNVKQNDTATVATPQKTAAEKKTEEESKKYDNYLLSTYLNSDELTATYLRKQNIFKGQASLYNERIVKLEKSLDKAKTQEKTTKDRASKKQLKSYIAITINSVKVYKEMILDNQKKLAISTKIYESDKARLIELLSLADTKEAESEG